MLMLVFRRVLLGSPHLMPDDRGSEIRCYAYPDLAACGRSLLDGNSDQD